MPTLLHFISHVCTLALNLHYINISVCICIGQISDTLTSILPANKTMHVKSKTERALHNYMYLKL